MEYERVCIFGQVDMQTFLNKNLPLNKKNILEAG